MFSIRSYTKTKGIKLSSTAIIVIILGALISLSLCLRIIIPYSYVFSTHGVNFVTPDPYYHMRLVENLLHHFPLHITFDPYTAFPNGNTLAWPPFFDWVLGGIIWIIGLGSPGQNLISTVGAFFPAVLGALVIIPVFFIGKIMFNRWAGLIAAALIAVMPGQFFGRSVLGYTDHHVMEVLVSTTMMLLFVITLKYARQNLKTGWRNSWADKKLLLYSSLTGLSLGIFLLTWEGGLFVVLLLFIYFIVQFIVDTLKSRPALYLGMIGACSFFIALIIVIILLPRTDYFSLYMFALPVAGLTPLVLAFLSDFVIKRQIKRVYYPATLACLGIAGGIALYFIAPSLFNSIIDEGARVFNVQGTGSMISEMRPLLFPADNFSLGAVWANFTTGFFLSLIAAGLMIVSLARQDEPDKILLLTWFLIMFVATLTQVRFAYYLVIEVALLTAYVCWEAFSHFLHYFGFDLIAGYAAVTIKGRNKKKKKEKRSKTRSRQLVMGVAIALILLIAMLPNLLVSETQAHSVESNVIPGYWYNAMVWLKNNTPEPFSDPDYYYQLYTPPSPGTTYKYPASAYGVLAWWDYGNWITEIAHRIPVANPFQQGAVIASKYYLAQNENSADGIIGEPGVKYVIVDLETAETQLIPLASFAGENLSDLYELYYTLNNGQLSPEVLFYPEYYQTMFYRLFEFNGKQVAAQSPSVVTWEDQVSPDGVHYKEIKNLQTFATYDEAEAYVSQHKTENCRIVGTDPTESPVPLDALQHYKLVYQSNTSISAKYFGSVSPIKIFEYTQP